MNLLKDPKEDINIADLCSFRSQSSENRSRSSLPPDDPGSGLRPSPVSFNLLSNFLWTVGETLIFSLSPFSAAFEVRG